MTKLDRAKKIISDNYRDAGCGIFDCPNFVGDTMETIYDEDGLQVDICYHWAYFEVFGLTEKEFADLKKFYLKLRR